MDTIERPETLDQRAERLVRQEVMCCLSSLVSIVASGHGHNGPRTRDYPHWELAEQAQELASPIDDYEEAAIQAGWKPFQKGAQGLWMKMGTSKTYDSPEAICHGEDLEPYAREVVEHWAVSDWLADKLEAHGEKVDKDFGGLCVWARTTTGQGIAADRVIQDIARQTIAAA